MSGADKQNENVCLVVAFVAGDRKVTRNPRPRKAEDRYATLQRLKGGHRYEFHK